MNFNTQTRPQIYLEKRYPIKGRKDFFKWVIVTPNGLAKDINGKDMYFDDFNLEQAKRVLKARRNVAKLNKGHLK
jgi:hypothetical protein